MSKTDPIDYFPLSYLDSRARFLRELEKWSSVAEVGQWKIPSQVDSDLTVDHAYWPALESPELLLVLTSGIHGPETYAGAAIQQMFLNEVLPRLQRQRLGVFVVHAMNPFGFKYHHRTTESGVNLNRNFSVSGALFKTSNPESSRLHERFYDRQPVTSERCALFADLKMRAGVPYFSEVSLDQFVKAISPGQFARALDLEFGGQHLEPQSLHLIEKLKLIMPAYRDVVALDLHTGLGDRGRLHLLTSGDEEDLHPELFPELFHQVEDQAIYVHTPASAKGFYEVHGALNSAFVELASHHQRICAITMEYGTLGHSIEAQLASLNDFILDHQGRYYGFADARLEAWSRQMNFEHFYPQNHEWQRAVIQSAHGLFERILIRAGALKPS